MTWIVAGNGVAFPFIAGDICVSWDSQNERECLQKIHPLTRNIIAGFSGSVKGGFQILNAIKQQLCYDQNYSLPRLSHEWLPRLMQREFRKLPSKEQSLQVQLILLSAHPHFIRGALHVPQSHTVRFKSPHFKPETTRGAECFGIGSGEIVDHYRIAAISFSTDVSFHQAIVSGSKNPALWMAQRLYDIVKEDPKPGISPLFIYGTVSLDEMVIEPLPFTTLGTSGTTHLQFPFLARNHQEFLNYCNRIGFSAEAASA
ncbi:MAG TPA: hypothetical protein VMH83_02205 [Candidatus Acidoferrum sp.]|nr:hypothetical protein [Candidatus Acidoferrum sp.]